MTPFPAIARQVVTLGDLTSWVRGLPPSAGGTAVVAVDGPSGSGKSTLAAALGESVGCPVVRMDDIYPGWDGLEDAVPNLVAWVLERLSGGEQAHYRRYDWVQNRYADWHDVPASRLLVVEGVSSGSRACSPFLAGLIWVEAEQEERFRRGIERDGEAYLPHWQRWAVQERAHFGRERTRDRADLILDGDGVPDGYDVGTAWTAIRAPLAAFRAETAEKPEKRPGPYR